MDSDSCHSDKDCEVKQQEAPLVEAHPTKITSNLCMKCQKEKPVVLVRVSDPLCRECFLSYFVHKFRATIGRSKVIRNGECVLIAYTGSASSASLVHLIEEGLGHKSRKKLRFVPGIVYVDDSIIIQQFNDDTCHVDQCQKIIESLGDCNFPCFLTSIEQAMIDAEKFCSNICYQLASGNKDATSLTNYTARNKLSRLIQDCLDLTAREDLISKLKTKLINQIARAEGYTKVMTAETGTKLAVRTISNLAQGHGASLSMDVSFSDDRCDDLVVLRPLKEFSSKEIAYYVRLCGIKTVFNPSLNTLKCCKASMNRLTESFVLDLQNNYPSTVSTICRTGDKLYSVENSQVNSENVCILCRTPLTHYPRDSELLLHTSQHMFVNHSSNSGLSNNLQTSNTGTCDKDAGKGCSCKLSNEKSVLLLWKQFLCYGCKVTVGDLEISKLPIDVQKEAHHRANRTKMREEIQDFLLSDYDDN